MRKIVLSIMAFMPAILFGQQKAELSLQASIDSALQNNYGIIVQQKNVDVAENQNSWGAAGALPNISFVGAASNSWSIMEDDESTSLNLSGKVDLSWTVFRGFSAKISKERFDELENFSEGNLNIVVENTLISVINTYYQALLNKERIRIAEEVAHLSEDRYTMEEEKAKLGSSGTYALLQAKNAYLEDQSNLLSAEANYKVGIRQLNYLMSVDLDAKYELTDVFEALSETFRIKELEERMMSNNFTLQNQYLNLKMAELDVRQAKSSYYPTVSLGVSGGYSDSQTEYDINTVMSNEISAWQTSVSASMTYSIYNGGVRKQSLQTSRIKEEIADVQTKDMEQEMKKTLRQELDYYDVRQKQLELAKENMEVAELNLQLSGERFENGSINSFNYRDVQQMYMSVALQYLNAIYSVQESYNAILRMTGGLVDSMVE